MQPPFPTLEELSSTGVPPVHSMLERDAQATPRGTGVPARANAQRSTNSPVRADLVALGEAVSKQPSPPS
ncbi:MAG: hypothetical protein N2554_02790, partial [Fimbriimonadales bacterium]|nr:hypothetical protein [Fimbriimonadales bacterium]